MILPKNVFFYDEEIPYEIKLDCTNLNLNFFISCLEIKLERIKKKGNKLNFYYNDQRESFLIKTIKINDNKKIKYNFKGNIYFPKKHINDEYIYPPSIYELIEKNGPYNTDDNFDNKFYFAPCSRGELVTVEYNIRIKIVLTIIFFLMNHIIYLLIFVLDQEKKIKKDEY